MMFQAWPGTFPHEENAEPNQPGFISSQLANMTTER
jgi:hypothetical protein